MADRMTTLYNQRCLDPSSELVTAMQHVEHYPSLRQWTGDYLARPLFAERAELRSFADDVVRLVDLLTELPERLFDGDLGRMCATLGFDTARTELMCRLKGASEPRYGRADMYHDGHSFKLLEPGIGSELGGWDRAGEIPRALMETAAFSEFANEHDLDYVHPCAAIAEALRS